MTKQVELPEEVKNRFDEHFMESTGFMKQDWYYRDGGRILAKEIKRFLAQELAQTQQEAVERIIKIADDLWKSPPWSPEWNDEYYKVEGYRRAMRDIQEALKKEQE